MTYSGNGPTPVTRSIPDINIDLIISAARLVRDSLHKVGQIHYDVYVRLLSEKCCANTCPITNLHTITSILMFQDIARYQLL
jgi:hypothetical protein